MHELIDREDTDRGWTPEPLHSRIFIRCYGSYQEAKRAYDTLRVVGGIPDLRMTMVARGLEWREPLTSGTLFKLGAALGALAGGAIGLVLWMLGFTAADTGWLAQTIVGALIGAPAGAALALLIRGLTRTYADVPETGHVAPRQFDILVDEELAPAARAALAR